MRYANAAPWDGPAVPLLRVPRAEIEPIRGSGRGLRNCVPAAFDTSALGIALGSESEPLLQTCPSAGVPEEAF